jgi:hypothetical protein
MLFPVLVGRANVSLFRPDGFGKLLNSFCLALGALGLVLGCVLGLEGVLELKFEGRLEFSRGFKLAL